MNEGLDIADEFRGLDLGDRRLDRRAAVIASRLVAAPATSFPKLITDPSELEALYRFMQNEDVSADALMAPHRRATARRCLAESVVRIAHDTTGLRYDGDREGIGSLGKHGTGFFAHAALAVGGGEARSPLGVIGLTTLVRTNRFTGVTGKERSKQLRSEARDEKESAKWDESVRLTSKLLPNAIHVMDQEADDYALFASLVFSGVRFVIRGDSNRRLSRGGSGHIQDVLDKAKTTMFRTVALAERSKPLPGHFLRGEREAELHVRSASVVLHRPQHAQSRVPFISLNVVQVFEPNPPKGEEPVEWTLLTTEPIETPEDVAAVVDHYRARWRIEELFRALKSGCSIEKRQLTSIDGLVRALAFFLPIAWRLLALRVLSRLSAPPPAETLFSDDDVTVIRYLAKEGKYALPLHPNVREVMLALARIGGHLKRNGEPGWITIGRGYDEFCAARRGFDAAMRVLGGAK